MIINFLKVSYTTEWLIVLVQSLPRKGQKKIITQNIPHSLINSINIFCVFFCWQTSFFAVSFARLKYCAVKSSFKLPSHSRPASLSLLWARRLPLTISLRGTGENLLDKSPPVLYSDTQQQNVEIRWQGKSPPATLQRVAGCCEAMQTGGTSLALEYFRWIPSGV